MATNELSNILIKNKDNIRSFIVTLLKNSEPDEILSLEGLCKEDRHLVYKSMGNGISFNKVIDDKKGTIIEFFRTNPNIEPKKVIKIPRNNNSPDKESGKDKRFNNDDASDPDYEYETEESENPEESEPEPEDYENNDEEIQYSEKINNFHVMDHIVNLNCRINSVYKEIITLLCCLVFINSINLFLFLYENNYLPE